MLGRGFYLFMLLVLLSGTLAPAQTPSMINYQGRLTGLEGDPIDTAGQMSFYIYDDGIGTELLWEETHPYVEVNRGLFRVVLGAQEPIPDSVFNGEVRFLAVQFESGPLSDPMTEMVAVPYAMSSMRSVVAAEAGFAASSGIAESLMPDIVESPHVVDGSLGLADLNHSGAVEGQIIKWLGDGWDVADDEIGEAFALPYSGTVATGGTAFYVANTDAGNASAVRGDAAGGDAVIGYTQSATKSGVYGYSNAGIGVSGRAEGNNHGVLGVSNSTGLHSGVRGVANGDGYGVSAWAEGTALFSKSSNGLAARLDGNVDIDGITTMTMDSGMAAWISSGHMDEADSGVVYINFTGEQNYVNWAANAALHCQSYTSDSAGVGAFIYGGEYGIICGSHAKSDMHPNGGLHASASGGNSNIGLDTWVDSRIDGSLQGSNNVGVWASATDGIATYGAIAQADKGYFSSYYPKWCYGVLASGTEADSACYGVHATGYNADTVYGVYARAYDGNHAAYGIYAKAPTGVTDWAGYFEGDVNVTGGFWAGDKYFKIDHPLDPENKYLTHACVEAPERLNVYSGTIALDSRGEATVELPVYFESLNGDYRYQLTPIGAAMPDLHIAAEVDGNNFTIAGGVSGKKVSWEVSGVRIDAYASANPMQVERDKPETERGRYLHPAAFGLDASSGIHGERKDPAPQRDEEILEKTRRLADRR